jgi:hypothetical protein
MMKPDTSRDLEKCEASSIEDHECSTANTSICSVETSSTSGQQSSGFSESPSSENLIYTIPERSLSKANSGFLTLEATELNIEVIAMTGSMDTQTTSSTKGSVPVPNLLRAATSFLKSKSAIGSTDLETDVKILSWASA